MVSARTNSDRNQGGRLSPFAGGKRVGTPNAACAVSRAVDSLGARTTTEPRWELASQFGSSKSTGISLQIGIATPNASLGQGINN